VAGKCKTTENSGKPGPTSLYGNLPARLQSNSATPTAPAVLEALTGSRKADVAQLVEQLIRNQQVIGSSPIVGSSKFVVPGVCPPAQVGIVLEWGSFSRECG
jgi:hypothetical protein